MDMSKSGNEFCGVQIAILNWGGTLRYNDVDWITRVISSSLTSDCGVLGYGRQLERDRYAIPSFPHHILKF